MAPIKIVQFPYLSDNYGILLHDEDSQQTIAIDAGDADAYNHILQSRGWILSQIWVTHHHWDHTDGIKELYQRWKCEVIGPKAHSQAPIAHLSHGLRADDTLQFGNSLVQILHTPGHTLDMINYYFPEEKILFSGDTLFSLGCGRVFEGDMDMMYHSLCQFLTLPDDISIYCSHEYTRANGRFALTVDAENQDLISRMSEVEKLLDAGQPTIPTNLGIEKKTNPFLRTSDSSIRKKHGLENASASDVFAALRTAKDNF